MPKPTLQQIFGANATVQNDELTIALADFADVGWDDPFGVNDPEKWLTAIVLKARQFSQGNSDQAPNIVVNEPYPGLLTRDEQLKREYSYSVQIYVPDLSASTPDPDLI